MSSFYKINRFDILAKMFKTIIIPEGVFEEFSDKFNRPKAAKPYILNATQRRLAEELGLGKGESQAIALAIDMKKFLAIDDCPARNVAKKLKVKIIGTFGLIKMAFEDCLINDTDRSQIISTLEQEQRNEEWLIKYVLDAKKP